MSTINIVVLSIAVVIFFFVGIVMLLGVGRLRVEGQRAALLLLLESFGVKTWVKAERKTQPRINGQLMANSDLLWPVSVLASFSFGVKTWGKDSGKDGINGTGNGKF